VIDAGASDGQRIEELIARLEPLDDPRLAAAKELVRAVLKLHARGLTAAMTILHAHAATPTGNAIVEACVRDRDFAALLVLHDLHPQPIEQRVQQALSALRPRLAVQGLAVRCIAIDATSVKLAVDANGKHGFSVPALRREIEDAIFENAPEVTAIDLGPLPSTGQVAFVPIGALGSGRAGEHA
jgi:hypothetical protein